MRKELGVSTQKTIEIKCLYSARNCDPFKHSFNFVYPDGTLRISLEYYYQIQGILQITSRNWCDLVILTTELFASRRIENSGKTRKKCSVAETSQST